MGATLNLDQMIADAMAAQAAKDAARAAQQAAKDAAERDASNARAFAWFASIFGSVLATALGVSAGGGHGIQQAAFTYRGVAFVALASTKANGIDVRMPDAPGNSSPLIGVPQAEATESLLAFIGRNTQG